MVIQGGHDRSEQTAADKDVIFVSERLGRSCKSVITQARLRALQQDIDKESQPTSARSGRPLVQAHTKKMVALEIARAKKKAGASAVKQEDPATAGDGPAKKDMKKKKKKPRNGQDTSAAAGKNPSSDDRNVEKKKTVNREGGEQVREAVKESSGSGAGNKGAERKNDKGRPSGNNDKVARATDANTVGPNTAVKEGGVENKQGLKKKKKKKKKKSEEVQSATSGEVIIIEDDDDEGRDAEIAHGVKKKKKKSRKQTTERVDEEEDGTNGERKKKVVLEISEVLQLSSEEEEAGEAGKRRRSGTQTENTQKVKTEGRGAEERMGKKKRKREGADLEEVVATEVQEVPRSCKKNNLQKKREEYSSGPADTAGVEGTVEKKKKKKKMGKSSTHLEEKGDKVILIENGEPAKKNRAAPKPKEGKSEGANVKETNKKKKRKKREVETEEEETPNKGASEEGCPPLETQKKKKKGETPVKKKKKMKIEREDSQDMETAGQVEVVFLSEKRGNTDEVTVNQARRLALQREVDQESHPNAPAPATAALGQWSSAQFDSTDKREKFLRLMGGFKKGSQPVAASGGRANMALGKEGQQSLQQGLLGEFERAQSRRMDFSGKGAGLGFSAPSNKKFSIDADARRSVRFDD